MALVLVGAFLASLLSGGQADVYARLAAVFAVAYLGGLGSYRNRS